MDGDGVIESRQEQTNGGADKAEIKHIKLVVVKQDLNPIHFRSKMTAQVVRIKKSYSERVGAPIGSMIFLCDGNRVDVDETPKP